MTPDVEATLAALRNWSPRFAHESDLQLAVAERFTQAGISFEREVALSAIDRIDFLVGDIGVEVKIKGAENAIMRQLMRYAQSTRICALVVVTTRWTLKLPETLHGKPVRRLLLEGNAL